MLTCSCTDTICARKTALGMATAYRDGEVQIYDSWIPVSKHRETIGLTLSACSESRHTHGYSQLHSTTGRQH